MGKKWVIKSSKSKIQNPKSIDEITKALLENRGLTSEKEVEEFLNPPHPFEISLSKFGISEEDLENAVEVIRRAVENGAPIIVHGDFDVDGICAAAILWETIYRGLGFEHGYGLSKASVDAVHEQVAQLSGCPAVSLPRCPAVLLITVDCGITAHEAIKYAQSRGFEVLVTDHHQRDEERGLEGKGGVDVLWTDKVCGAGIAYLLASRLANPKSTIPSSKRLLKSQLELVSLATVADVQPLLGPNRSFVKYGLGGLNRTSRVGIQELIKMAGIAGRDIGTYEVGWILAPRLNAAGRLDSAMDALRLLCTRDRGQARELAGRLEWVNRERQIKTDEMTEQAVRMTGNLSHKVTVVSHESYHEGVIGLVAGNLVEGFCRPAVVIAKGGKFSKGSARSVAGFNIVEALRQVGDLFESLGGHPMAAGFTIRTERIKEFEERFSELGERIIDEDLLSPVLSVDLEIPLPLVSWKLWERVSRFEPVGYANPRPLFLSRGVGVVDVAAVGNGGKHLKLKLQPIGESLPSNQRHALGSRPVGTLRDESVFTAIGFGMGAWSSRIRLGDTIDVVYSLAESEWDDRHFLELRVKDLKESEAS